MATGQGLSHLAANALAVQCNSSNSRQLKGEQVCSASIHPPQYCCCPPIGTTPAVEKSHSATSRKRRPISASGTGTWMNCGVGEGGRWSGKGRLGIAGGETPRGAGAHSAPAARAQQQHCTARQPDSQARKRLPPPAASCSAPACVLADLVGAAVDVGSQPLPPRQHALLALQGPHRRRLHEVANQGGGTRADSTQRQQPAGQAGIAQRCCSSSPSSLSTSDDATHRVQLGRRSATQPALQRHQHACPASPISRQSHPPTHLRRVCSMDTTTSCPGSRKGEI
jgi:hypothetical protein